MELLDDFPPGPLDAYRKKASFDWKQLKVLLDTEDIIIFKNEVVKALQSDPVFDPHDDDFSLDEIRRDTLLKEKSLDNYEALYLVNSLDGTPKLSAALQSMTQWNPSVTLREGLKTGLFANVIRALGTEQHQHYAHMADNYELLGCFAMTEIGHGSNTKMLQTRATYDKTTRTFVIHSPNFEAAKCWSGMAGQCATHAVLYAQLYTSDEVCHGIHQFVVEIRDTKSHLPSPGVIIADMGHKIGLNGIDNGVIMFDNYRVPKSALLNKHCDVTDDGVYIPKMKDPKKRFGSSLYAITSNRLNVSSISLAFLLKGITIAVRYSAVRKQFSPDDSNEELPILEYQLQQYRLLPYLAGCIVHQVALYFLTSDNTATLIEIVSGNPRPDEHERGIEIHAISTACKSFSSWFHRDGLQECREACAGHGYLKVARLGDCRNDNDVNMTYEGENNVLVQQTSNWLLKLWPMVLNKEHITSPYESVSVLNKGLTILSLKCKVTSIEEMMRPDVIINTYQWLICHLLKSSAEKYQNNLKQHGDSFRARNDNQIFYAKDLTLVYIQHYFLHRFLVFIESTNDVAIKRVLENVFALYALFNLEKHVAHLYKGAYFVSDLHSTLLHDSILRAMAAIKDDAVALVDVIAPHDYLLNSVLGNSDGQVYQHLQRAIFTGKNNMTRPTWWQEIMHNQSKL